MRLGSIKPRFDKTKGNQPKEKEKARSTAFKPKRILYCHEEVKTWKEEKARGFAFTFEESPVECGEMEKVGEGEGETGQGGGEGEGEEPGKVGEEEGDEEADVDEMVKPAEVPPARSAAAGLVSEFQHEGDHLRAEGNLSRRKRTVAGAKARQETR